MSGFFWGGLMVLYIPLMYFFVPETRGRTFAEIDELFEKKISARKFASFETEHQLGQREHEVAP